MLCLNNGTGKVDILVALCKNTLQCRDIILEGLKIYPRDNACVSEERKACIFFLQHKKDPRRKKKSIQQKPVKVGQRLWAIFTLSQIPWVSKMSAGAAAS